MPLVRLVRTSAGEISIDPSFVPPLLDIAASPFIMGIAHRILERVGREGIIARRRAAPAQPGARRLLRHRRRELLAAVHAQHASAAAQAPARGAAWPSGGSVGSRSLALAGALTTFDLVARPFPVYEHARLGDCFAALEAQLLELLETAVPEVAVALPLRTVRPSVQAVAVEQERWLGGSVWYLAVSAPIRQAELVTRVLRAARSARRTSWTRSFARHCRASSSRTCRSRRPRSR